MPSTAAPPRPRRPTGPQILALYDQLLALAPTPVVALNRAVAVTKPTDQQAALDLIDELPLEHYYVFHAIRADLFGRLGRRHQAEAAYRAAIERTDNTAEIAFMEDRISTNRAATRQFGSRGDYTAGCPVLRGCPGAPDHDLDHSQASQNDT